MQQATALEDFREGAVPCSLPDGTRVAVLKELFNRTRGQCHDDLLQLEPYFAYYKAQCMLALHGGGRHSSRRTHEDIFGIVQCLNASLPRSTIRARLRQRLAHSQTEEEDESLDCSIDLAARVWLMVELGDFSNSFSGRKQLEWKDGSLQDYLQCHFATPPVLGSEGVKLERLFNARNLGRIAGMEIVWTSNLADHLRVLDEDRKVAIFHHASFLELHKKSTIFPPGFIEETERTLALLFPQSDDNIKGWLNQVAASRLLDRHVRMCGHLRADDRRIESFRFWHDRLVVLKQVFDEAEPRTLSQWWYDRRRGTVWYTFWIAAIVLLLTVFFGAVQCLLSALQVYKAFNPAR